MPYLKHELDYRPVSKPFTDIDHDALDALITRVTEAKEHELALSPEQEALEMRQLSAHNIRHTGISHDVNLNHRPISHVQADAGHESIDTTSQYIHTTDTERYQSAINKSLDNLSFAT